MEVLEKGTVLDRFFEVARSPKMFNPCRGDASRFAPLWIDGVCVPTLYLGETYAAAAFETVFRDMPPTPLPRRIFEQSLAGKGHARLKLMRSLKLAPFFDQNLRLIGQSRRTMIVTDATAYDDTVKWAALVHGSLLRFDGIIWTSGQHDRDWACVLFGDRVSRSDLRLLSRSRQAIDTGPGRATLDRFAKDYDIAIIPP